MVQNSKYDVKPYLYTFSFYAQNIPNFTARIHCVSRESSCFFQTPNFFQLLVSKQNKQKKKIQRQQKNKQQTNAKQLHSPRICESSESHNPLKVLRFLFTILSRPHPGFPKIKNQN
jgi:hypothetical protein